MAVQQLAMCWANEPTSQQKPKRKRWDAITQAIIDAGPMPETPQRAELMQRIKAVHAALVINALATGKDGLLALSQSLKDGELAQLHAAYWVLWRADSEAWEARFGRLPLRATHERKAAS